MKMSLFILAAPIFIMGCGLSKEYRYNGLKMSSNDDVCMAIADPRASTIGFGWAVQKQAAEQIARERNLQCDYEKYARIHAMQNSVGNSIAIMQTGASMMNQGGGSAGVPSSGGAMNGIAFFRSTYISGLNRICIYDRLGSQVVTTIGATQICPQTIQ